MIIPEKRATVETPAAALERFFPPEIANWLFRSGGTGPMQS
jgi:hypothetical protein